MKISSAFETSNKLQIAEVLPNSETKALVFSRPLLACIVNFEIFFKVSELLKKELFEAKKNQIC